MKKQYLKPVFKDYNRKQMMLLPPSLDELIEPGHPVRIVVELIDKVDDTSLLKQYKGGGTSSYHPRMLLKEIFAQVVMMLAETGRVILKDVYLDGTKIEANANRYTFVWGKAIKILPPRGKVMKGVTD